MGCHVACPLDLDFAKQKIRSPGQMPFFFKLLQKVVKRQPPGPLCRVLIR